MKRRTMLGLAGALPAGVMAGAAGPPRASASDLPPLPSPIAGPPPDPDGVAVRGRMTGAMAAVRTLRVERTPCVFGVPGAQNNEFWDAMKAVGQPYCLVAHESAASVMADACSRVSGRVGTFAVIPGPGLTNAMTGIGEALLDTVPVVGLVTDVRRGPGAPVGQVHSLPNAGILRTVTKSVVEAHHVGQIPGAIHAAFRLARLGAPGPVGVVIPYDLYPQVWDFDEPVPVALAPPWDEGGYRRALPLLADRSNRVGIYAGNGCADATDELRAVAELLQAPVATTVSGKGVLPDAHPLAVGWGYGPFGTVTAERRFRDVDVVLAIGTRYSEVSTANFAIPEGPRVIHVDVDPAVIGRNVPTCVGVRADAGLFLGRLLADARRIARPADSRLAGRIREDRQLERCANLRVEVRGGVDPMRFLALLGEALRPCGLLFVDVTASTHWAAEGVRVDGPRRYFAPADNQSMGWAVSAAIGGQRTRPDLPVACVTGDGCFLMSGLEASTAARLHLPVKFFVLDDGAYHYMQMLQDPVYGRTTATELPRLDFAGLARGMGLSYREITANEEVPAAIRDVLARPLPTLVRVAISYEGREIRWLKALRSHYLEELGPEQRGKLIARALVRRVNPLLQDD